MPQHIFLPGKPMGRMRERAFTVSPQESGILKENEVHSLCYAPNIHAKSISPGGMISQGKSGAPLAQSAGENPPSFLNDYSLAQKALGDLEVAEVLLRRVYPKIYEVVQSVVGHAENLDDIAQLAAMDVARYLDRYRGRGSIESWAAKIAYRKAARVTKREWKKRVATVPFIDDNLEDNDTLNPEKRISSQQLLDSLFSKMNGIPSNRRVPLLLHVLHGYTVREVSELTGTPVNTVKDRLKTAFREYYSILERNSRLVAAMLEEML